MQARQDNRVLPQVPAVSELIEELERRLRGSYAPSVRRTSDQKWVDQTTTLATDTEALIRSMGFEPLPLEECRQRNKALWDQSLLGRKQTCHGCGGEFTEFYMIYVFKDNSEQQHRLSEDLVQGRETLSSYRKKSDALIHAEHPDDGWYCTRTCYRRNSDRHADSV